MLAANRTNVHPLIVTLERRDELSTEERRAIEALSWRLRTFEAGEEMVRQNSRPVESCLILEGFAARAYSSRDGARQIMGFYIAGNFVDLHCFLLKQIDHAIIAMAKCKVAFVPHEALQTVTEQFPHLTRLLWTLTEIDCAVLRAWIFALGRRNALQRLAHLVCEMFCRMQAIGLTNRQSFAFPINQGDLGDMLGLSTVHTNRTLQELRGTALIAWQKQTVTIRDWDGLVRLAEFDPTYLNLHREPR